MQKNKYTIPNFTPECVEYQLVLPINFEVMIPQNDSVRLLSQIVEELDLRSLMLAYSSKGRNPVVPPRIMLKILLYAYMNGIFSSRVTESCCKRDINFMWLLEGYPAPDHNTISRFRTGRLKNCLEIIFNEFIEKLHLAGELPFENTFIDGTKIEANANKYSFVWKKSTQRYESKLPEKAQTLFKQINKEYGTSFELNENHVNLANVLKEIIAFLVVQKERNNITFVSGVGKHKTILQRLMEQTLELLEKKEKYMDYMKEFDNRNSFSKTDRDATFMHMKDDHMRNSQLKPGYNLQIAVENGYTVGIDISSERSDMYTLIPLLEKLEKNFPSVRFENVVCDAGYESEENYAFLSHHGYTSYIKPSNYETQKKRNFKTKIGQRENMQYDEANDEYVCAKGRKLKVIAVNIDKRRRSRYPVELTTYECENCNRCSLKTQCKKSKGKKRIKVSKRFVHYRETSQSNVTSDKGIILRINRSIQAEGAFGMIKEDYNFRRFLTRGKENVFIECLIMFFSYNVNKLHNKNIGKGNKKILYTPKAA
jgi:transposase